MKPIILIALVSLTFCLTPLFDEEELRKTHKDSKSNGYPVTTEICMEEDRFKMTRISVDPMEIIKGGSILVKVQGEAQEPMIIKNLHISTQLNGLEVWVDDQDQGMAELDEGDRHEWEYEASVPSFCPSGSFDIYFTLVTDKDETVSCLLGHFDVDD